MLKIVNFFRGYLVVRISGPFPERFLNLCAQNGVAFWRLKKDENGDFVAKIRQNRLKSLQTLATRALCTTSVERKVGAPFILARFRERYAFLLGAALAIGLIAAGALRVWEFEVVGAETLDPAAILAQLEELGVAPGTLRSAIDPDALETEMLLREPRLRWLTVNVSGSRATVEVRERIDPPELLDRSSPQNVVASRAGVIEKIVVLEGKARVAAGETVEPGQLLVSGVLDMVNEELQTTRGVRLVSARAVVTARTWYEFSAKTPLFELQKLPTGVETEKISVVLGKKRINLFVNSSILTPNCDRIESPSCSSPSSITAGDGTFCHTEIRYDKKIERTRLELPGGFKLPIVVEKTQLLEHESVEVAADRETLEERLRLELEQRLGEATDGEILTAEFEFYEDGECLVGVLRAECREDIALGQAIPIGEQKVEN